MSSLWLSEFGRFLSLSRGHETSKFVERSERTNIKGDLESLSDAELAAIVRQGQPEPQVSPEQLKKLN